MTASCTTLRMYAALGALGVPSNTKLIHHPVVILSAAKDLVFESLAGNGHAQADRSRIAGRHQAVAALLRWRVGIHDFAPFIKAATVMTTPLRDLAFFARHFIKAGALAWPNGFDVGVGSLCRHFKADDKLRHAA